MKKMELDRKQIIGEGTFGKVFKVTKQSGEIRALKIIKPEFHDLRFQFRSAFETAKKIDDPNCLKMYDWISDEDVSWTMEYVDGKPLSFLKFTDRESLDKILKVMIRVCNGLIALHSRNIIHRDLKPENILITTDGIVKITDFDFIKTGFSEKKRGQFFGTPEYSSPEHFIASYELDTRSDLYSLGVILYELLTGKLPFEGKTAKEIGDLHRLKPLVLPIRINPEIPQSMEKIVLGLLEKEQNDRYQNAHSVAADLLKEINDKNGIKIKRDVSYILKPKFVNMTTPLKTLNKLSDELKNQNGNIVLILGESGIGKSKLVQQFYYHLQLHDISFYQSICKTVESAFNPLKKIFEEIIVNQPEADKLKYFGQFGWDLVKYGILSKQDWMKKIKKPTELSGQNAEIRLFSAITDFLKNVADKPIIICIDDLHWADEQIMKWLKYAERNLKGFPILIIGLHRSEHLFDDSPLLQIENLIQIKIKNLKEIDVSEMIKSMLGKKRKNKEMSNFIENIVSHTKGNPLFIREMLYFLNEKGKISIIGNKWNFPPKIEIETLPENIQTVISERLDELTFESSKTMQIASIIGKRFSYQMLLHLTNKKENELLENLIDCREVSLLEKSGNDFVFIHDKIREVFEDELKDKNPEKWKDMHQKAGEYLEDNYSENTDEILDELADHFYKAEDAEKSIKYLEQAGDRAKKNYQNEKAFIYFSYLAEIPNFKARRKLYFDLLRKKEEVLKHIGKWDKGIEIITEALMLAKDLNDKARMAIAYGDLGGLHLLQGNYPEAMENFDHKIKLNEELGNKIGIAETNGDKGVILAKQGNLDKSLDFLNKYLTLSNGIDYRVGTSKALGNLGIVYRLKSNFAKALDCLQQKIKLSEEMDDKPEIINGYNGMGNVYNNQGNFTQAIECYEKGLRIGIEIGHKYGIVSLISNLGFIYELQGKYAKSMEYFEKGLKYSEELGDKSGKVMVMTHMGSIFKDQKNYVKALELYNKTLVIAKKLNHKRSISGLIGNIGLVNEERGKYAEAIKCYEEQLKICEEIGDKLSISRTFGNMGVTYTCFGKYKKALECSYKYLTMSKELKNNIGISISNGAIGLIYITQGKYQEALKCLNKAIEIGNELDLKPHLQLFNFNKAECFFKMKKYEQSKKSNNECQKIIRQTKNDELIFGCKIRAAKIEFKISMKDKIPKGIEPLKKMLGKAKKDEYVAELNYELALMYNELKDKEKTELHKTKAVELYKSLYKKITNINFKDRYEKLERLTPEVS